MNVSKLTKKLLTKMFILDPCINKNCGGKGQCSVDPNDLTDGYKCNCNVGYNGNDCEAGK